VYKTGTGEDVTGYYTLNVSNYADGESYKVMTVSQREITITTGSSTKEYDEMPLTNSTYYVSYGTLAEGHEVYVAVTGKITNRGTAENYISKESLSITDENDNDVTDNYKVTWNLGALKIV
jgi:hypothetical protein